jgi:hypothetical protein
LVSSNVSGEEGVAFRAKFATRVSEFKFEFENEAIGDVNIIKIQATAEKSFIFLAVLNPTTRIFPK